MPAPIACVKRAWRSFGRVSGSQPSAWFWAWSWDPLKLTRRHPPHHLSPARANHPAGQDPEAHLTWRDTLLLFDNADESGNTRSAHDPSPETSGVLGYSNEGTLRRRPPRKLRGTSRGQ